MIIHTCIHFYKILLSGAQLCQLQEIIQMRYDRKVLILDIFFEAKTISTADTCLLIPLVLTKFTFKIEIIPKELSPLNEIISFWPTELIELNLQKLNINFSIWCTSIRL